MKLIRKIAYSAGLDSADRSMRAAGRSMWNEDDYNIAVTEFNRLWPLCEHGADRECCIMCINPESR